MIVPVELISQQKVINNQEKNVTEYLMRFYKAQNRSLKKKRGVSPALQCFHNGIILIVIIFNTSQFIFS